MDLKKSIEKAKKLRLETKPSLLSELPVPERKEAEKGWLSPDYCKSQCVELDRKNLWQNRCICISPDAKEIDHYKVLRTQIQHRCEEKGWNTIMITSVQPGEGKTLTAINLALAFAQEFTRTVLLVDCDLKRLSIHRRLKIPVKKGLVDHLVDDIPLEELIIWPGIEKLTMICGGKSVPNTAELLSSPKMKATVDEMKKRYQNRYIFFDVPPVLSAADALAFAPLVDCVLIVVQAGRTSIPDVNKALEMIPEEKFLGFVLNRQKSLAKTYYYQPY
jgi:non-specific protein-tyrosine kinase